MEYRADLVLFLTRGSRYVLGIIVEVQLSRDERKSYAWPAYVANLRARHRCPVCLLVITTEDSVARWAESTIDLGPGSRCAAWVVGPSNTPVVTEIQQARANVELAVLSAIEHRHNPDTDLAKRIVATALTAVRETDDERADVYLDFIHSQLESTPQVLEDAMTSVLLKYQSEFARRYVSQGIAQGKVEGKMEGMADGKAEGRLEIILELLATRFGALPDSIQTRVRDASAAQLHALARKVLIAQSLQEALDSL